MDALILSCSTGGGHHAAARAIAEEWRRQGGCAVVLDPYTLVGHDMDKHVGNGYIRIVQRTPRLFGAIYWLGNEYRRLPIHSPIYAINKLMQKKMSEYLSAHSFDVIISTHVYPGEILACLKHKGVPLPPCFFVATDYTCIPFTEETDSDYYIIPHPSLAPEYVKRKIPEERLLPFGIPTSRSFSEPLARETALEMLGFDPGLRYLVLSGGSIGAGALDGAIRALEDYLYAHPKHRLVVICGNNERLYEKAKEKYGSQPQLILLGHTDQMPLYLKGADVYLSKPGGLSSTEAAVCGIPLVHISPIPGCESYNMDFFGRMGMSLPVGQKIETLPKALTKLEDAGFLADMRHAQTAINAHAAEHLCRFAASIVQKKEEA